MFIRSATRPRLVARCGVEWQAGGGCPAARLCAAVCTLLLTSPAWDQIARSLAFSPRELQVARLILLDEKQDAIAADLKLSTNTVHDLTGRLFRKLDVHTRLEFALRIVHEALLLSERGLLPPICPKHARGLCPWPPPA
jgi:DNA-binding CsgD family transcriptional regulator